MATSHQRLLAVFEEENKKLKLQIQKTLAGDTTVADFVLRRQKEAKNG